MFPFWKYRDFTLLWAGRTTSMLGNSLLKLAILIHVFDATGSTRATTAAFIAEWAPLALLGISGGVLADRLRAKDLLVGSDVIRAAVLVPLLFAGDSLWVILAVLIIQSSVGTAAEPAFMAAIPGTVPRDQLARANSLTSAVVAAVGLIGVPAGAALYGIWGFRFVVYLDIASFLVSGVSVLLARLPDRRPSADARTRTTIRMQTAEGLRYLRTNETCRALLGVGLLFGIVEGAVSPLYIPYLRGVLHAAAAQISAINVAEGVGALVLSLLCGSVAARIGMGRTLCAGTAVAGAALALAGVAPNIWVGGLAMALIAGGTALISPMIRTIVQVAVSPAYLGRVFGAMMTIMAIVSVAASGIPAVLAGTMGVRVVLVMGAVVAAAALVQAVRKLWGFDGSQDREAVLRPAELEPDWTAVG